MMKLTLFCLMTVFVLSTEAFFFDEEGNIDFGLATDRTNVVGILLGTVQELANYLIQINLGSLKFPYQKIHELAILLGSPRFASFGDRLAAIVEVFVRNASGGASFHIQFVQGLFIIFYNMVIDLIRLFPALDSVLNSNFARMLIA